MRRQRNSSVRIGLWSGEEQGLYGSKAYVKQHFGDPQTMKIKPAHAKLSGYVARVTIRNTIGADHLSFDAVGLPGFRFIQDPFDYASETHYSTMDTFDHAQAAYLMQAAAVIATVVYDDANRPEMLPRKELPRPQARPAADASGTVVPKQEK